MRQITIGSRRGGFFLCAVLLPGTSCGLKEKIATMPAGRRLDDAVDVAARGNPAEVASGAPRCGEQPCRVARPARRFDGPHLGAEHTLDRADDLADGNRLAGSQIEGVAAVGRIQVRERLEVRLREIL